jgi:hypothetical protein
MMSAPACCGIDHDQSRDESAALGASCVTYRCRSVHIWRYHGRCRRLSSCSPPHHCIIGFWTTISFLSMLLVIFGPPLGLSPPCFLLQHKSPPPSWSCTFMSLLSFLWFVFVAGVVGASRAADFSAAVRPLSLTFQPCVHEPEQSVGAAEAMRDRCTGRCSRDHWATIKPLGWGALLGVLTLIV